MLAAHVGRVQEFKALGRDWRLGRWTRAVWSALLEWAKPRILDPFDVAEKAMKRFPEKFHAEIVRDAVERAGEYLAIGSPSVMQAIGNLEGTAHLSWLLLKPAHPGLTEDEAFDIVVDVGVEKMALMLKRASGEPPPPSPGNPPAPAAG